MRLARWIGTAAICTAALMATPTMAQGASEEIIVTGRAGDAPSRARTLSQAVSYADLDLSTREGRDLLRHRVRLTARFLCDKLGEGGSSGSPVVTSCRDEASRDAINRVGTLEATAAPRGTTWVRPPTWQAPYPSDWYATYP